MEANTILLIIVLGLLVGILVALRRIYSLERKIGAVELLIAKKTTRTTKKKAKRKR